MMAMRNRNGNVRFSVFLTCTLLIFTGLSLMLVIGSFYGVLERAMTHEYLLKIRFDQERFGNGMEDRLEAVLEEVARVREDLGFPVVVSPFAQFVAHHAKVAQSCRQRLAKRR